MSPLTRKLPVFCLGSALQFFAVSAPAQQAATQAPTVSQNSNSAAIVPIVPIAVFPFMVRARTDGRRIEVRSSHDQAIARCVGGCWLSLPSGDYKALFYDQSGAEHEFKFSVQGPGGIEIEDADPETESTGLVLGIAGSALVVGGTVLMTVGLQHACLMAECPNQQNSEAGLLLGGFVAFVAGAVMTPIGWVTFARNRHPRLHMDPTAIKVAVIPNRDGAFLGLSGQF
jgi:hypothetical protein